MELTLKLDIRALPVPISYADHILLTGSCFTEHISERLTQHKFSVLSNPNGILFNPLSVARSLDLYISGKRYEGNELFYLNELWNSWDHHTRFSDTGKEKALERINSSQEKAAAFIRKADWIIITLGSAFQYFHKEEGRPVSNNHRAPSGWFDKKLLEIGTITEALSESMQNILSVNPAARFLFTVSPVRHIRDGVVDNNRSKARLLEAVHLLCEAFNQAWYFPAYELMIDILRDYRFYDIDFVHPNYLGTNYVWERFVETCIAGKDREVMKQVQEVSIAKAHKARFPETESHNKFKERYRQKIMDLMLEFPFLDLREELEYFS